MKDAFLQVAAFERLCGHELPDVRPNIESSKLAKLREDLIAEESRETTDVLAILRWAIDRGIPFDDIELADLADGLADTIFVCIGTAIRCGIDLPTVWDRVCDANLKKFGPGSHVREDGKRLKPPSWQPPDILGVIKSQKPLSEIYGHEMNKETQG